jgi:hypothetical protein
MIYTQEQKKQNMMEYEKYLHYRATYRNKLSFQEYKKNHKDKYMKWRRRQYAIRIAEHFIRTQKITKKEFNETYTKTWEVHGSEKLYKTFNKTKTSKL